MNTSLEDIQEENKAMKFYVYAFSAYTGRCVYASITRSTERIEVVADEYMSTNHFLVLVNSNVLNVCSLCFSDKVYTLYIGSSKYRDRMLNLLYEVTCGLYDNARDAFNIEFGRVIELLTQTDVDEQQEEDILHMIYSLWELRYKSKN